MIEYEVYLDEHDTKESVQASAKTDLFMVLDKAPNEAKGVLQALHDGRVDGTVWQEGNCGCLIGTIGTLQCREYDDIPNIDHTNYDDIQDWFEEIHGGDTPADNEYSAKVAEWIEEWLQAKTQ